MLILDDVQPETIRPGDLDLRRDLGKIDRKINTRHCQLRRARLTAVDHQPGVCRVDRRRGHQIGDTKRHRESCNYDNDEILPAD